MFQHEHLNRILRLIEKQNVSKKYMSRFLKHPKCQDFPAFSRNSKKLTKITFEYVTITIKYHSSISFLTKIILIFLRIGFCADEF